MTTIKVAFYKYLKTKPFYKRSFLRSDGGFGREKVVAVFDVWGGWMFGRGKYETKRGSDV